MSEAERVAVLAIDAGTTGTRAARVERDGGVRGLSYRRLDVRYPAPGHVEQDAQQILDATVDVVRTAVAQSHRAGVHIAGLALSQQRLTAVVWDAATGEPLAPAIVWQDTRYAEELAQAASGGAARMIEALGRPVGFGSPYLWGAHLLRENDEVRSAHARGALRIGTIDTWLLWHLSRERTYATSVTNASAAGSYDAIGERHSREWVAELGFPAELLPELRPDQADYGTTDAQVCGVNVPILGAVGDQQAGAIGLGSIRPGQAACVHGTGSFVTLNNGASRPTYDAREAPGAIPLVAWSVQDRTRYLAEGIVPTTGAAMDWVCERLGWFESPEQIARLALENRSSGGAMFLPALAGVMTLAIAPAVRASFTGLSATTTKGALAVAIVEGIAHAVTDALEADAVATGSQPQEINIGGGMAASDALAQAQADLAGLPVLRHPHADAASLRGAAFLAASEGTLWDSLDEAVAKLPPADVFEPAASAEDRAGRRRAWRDRLALEIEAAQNGDALG